MKKLFAVLTIICLVLTAGCAGEAIGAVDVDADEASSGLVEVVANAENTAPQPDSDDMPDPMEEDGSLMAQVVSVSGSELTVYLAERNAPGDGGPGGERADREGPGGRGERPDGDGEPPERPDGGEKPEGMPEGGPDGEGRPGGGRGMGIQFSEEETVYPLADSATVVKGMGDGETTLALDDLAVGDTVRIVLDDSGAVTGIHIMEEPGMDQLPDRQAPPEQDGDEA